MKSLLFTIFFFIQLGFSQDFNKKLTDTIILDDIFFKKINNQKEYHFPPIKLNIDSTHIINRDSYRMVNVNILFCNRSKSLILIDNVHGGSNYVSNNNHISLIPNSQNTIKMSLAFGITGNKFNRVLAFSIHSQKNDQNCFAHRRQTFLINKNNNLKVKDEKH